MTGVGGLQILLDLTVVHRVDKRRGKGLFKGLLGKSFCPNLTRVRNNDYEWSSLPLWLRSSIIVTVNPVLTERLQLLRHKILPWHTFST